MTLIQTLKNSKTLYRQWRNLNVLCPDRLTEQWRIQESNLVDEYEIFCASLTNLIATQDPAINPDLTLSEGMTLLEMKYQPSHDTTEYLIVPKIQAVSAAHNLNCVITGALTDKPASEAVSASRVYAKKLRREGRVPMVSRGFSATSEWIWMDGNLLANYRFSPETVHILKIPRSLLESGYVPVLPKMPDSCFGVRGLEEILQGLQFSNLVSEPLLITYSAQQEEYNEVLSREYAEALRVYQTEQLPAYDRASYIREEAMAKYMAAHHCAEYDIPASELPPRPILPKPPKKPVITEAALPATFETWTQDCLVEQMTPISMGMLTALYDNYFSDTDISRVRAILNTLNPMSDDWLYLSSEELQLELNLDLEREAVRKYLKAESNAYLRKTDLGIKLMMEVTLDGEIK